MAGVRLLKLKLPKLSLVVSTVALVALFCSCTVSPTAREPPLRLKLPVLGGQILPLMLPASRRGMSRVCAALVARMSTGSGQREA